MALPFCSAYTDYGTSAAGSTGTTITSGSGAKGSYAQIVAATDRDASFLIIGIHNFSTNGIGLIDIAIGGSGSEQIIINNLSYGDTSGIVGQQYWIPIKIPAGSRIAARWRSTNATQGLQITCIVGSGSYGFQAFSTIDTYGAGTTIGTAVDPGGTANTKGAYAQLVASTTRDHAGLIVSLDNQNDFTLTAAKLLLDIAVGAAASEQVILPNLMISQGSDGRTHPYNTAVIPVQIPVGTRLSARCQSTANGAGLRLIGVVAYGLS